MKVQISKGGVVHRGKGAVTVCGKGTGNMQAAFADELTCKSCIKIEARTAVERELGLRVAIETLTPSSEPIQAERGPVNMDAKAQADGVALRRAGMALMGNCHYNTWSARLAFTHGFFSLHESCECKISGDVGYTYDLATHTMIKNPPARQYTQAEPTDDVTPFVGVTSRQTPEELRAIAQRLFAPSWRGKRKGSKAKRQLSHA